MKNFEYAAPRTEGEALELLNNGSGNTEVLAGGTDLVGLMKSMVVTPDRVVNIMETASLKTIETTVDGGVVFGAALSLEQVAESQHLEPFPSVLQAIAGINSMQLQAQGTLGGELCQRPRCWYFRSGHGLLADNGARVMEGDDRYHAIFGNAGLAKFVSASRLAPALIVCNAAVRVIGPAHDQERWIPVADLYRVPRHAGQRENVLLPGQLLTHVALPPAQGLMNAAYEVRQGCGPDYPLAAAAASFRHSGGIVQEAQIVLGHVAPVPWLAPEAAQQLMGGIVDQESARRASRAAVAQATPLSGNQYKVSLARVAVERAVLLAAGLDPGGF